MCGVRETTHLTSERTTEANQWQSLTSHLKGISRGEDRSSTELKVKRWITNCSLECDAERQQFGRYFFDSGSLLADAVTLDASGREG